MVMMSMILGGMLMVVAVAALAGCIAACGL